MLIVRNRVGKSEFTQMKKIDFSESRGDGFGT